MNERTPSTAFPHRADDCSGDLVLEGDAQWVGDHYVHRWYCPECEVTALEAFTPDGFVEDWVDSEL